MIFFLFFENEQWLSSLKCRLILRAEKNRQKRVQNVYSQIIIVNLVFKEINR